MTKGGEMNKGELVEAIARDAKLSKAQAQSALDAFVGNVQRSLKRGDKVTLVGFGTFSTSSRSARTGRNPQTGMPIKIPAKKVAKFSAGKALKDSIQ
ncbi:MAG: HU family DNA-binding protein [Acidobacteriota bacterium]